jgi:hypothetical protein
MKCFTLCTLVLIASAGCGAEADGMVNQDARQQDPRLSARNAVELRAAEAYAAVFGADTAQTCLSAWHDDQAQQGNGPIYKPEKSDVAALKAFLCACVGGNNCPDF